MALNPSNPRKMTEDDWASLAGEIETIFVPGTAIKEQELFAGRKEQIQKLCDAVRRPGKHAIVYGERGVGKSSIAQTFHLFIARGPRETNVVRVQASDGDNFTELWRKVFKRIEIEKDGTVTRVSSLYPGQISPDDVYLELSKFPINSLSIIILDELDRIVDSQTKRLLADTIKALADETAIAKLICVGVADSVGELILGHESINRALIQVEMPRMSDDEMRDLIVARLRRLGMTIKGDALWRIIFIAKGLPFYGHLLGLHASLEAVRRHSLKVEERDIDVAMKDSLQEVDQSLRDAYDRATTSERQKNIFKQVLLACALAARDDLGRFTAKSVAERLSLITHENYDVPAFAYHLDEFCKDRVLNKIGIRKQFKYRFRDSLMEAFVVLKSLQLRIISTEAAKELSPKLQHELFASGL